MDVRVSVETLGEIDRNINIEIPRALYDSRFNEALSTTARKVSLKGFRPGKAPKTMVAKLYGERIHAEVVEGLVSRAYDNAVKEHSLRVVGQPDVTIDNENKESDLKVTAKVSVFPQPEIKDFRGVSFEVEVEPYNAASVDARLEEIRGSLASFEKIEDKSQVRDGDIYVVDFDGLIDGAPFKGSKRDNAVIEIGEGKFPAEFEQGIRELGEGEEGEVEVTMPPDFEDADVAGKTATYKVTVRSMHRKQLPALDDEFAKKTGYAETFEELRNKVEFSLKRETEEKNKRARENKLFQEIINKNHFEIPKAMIDDEVRNILFEMRVLDPKDRRSYEMDVSRFAEHLGGQAEFRVRKGVVLDRLVEQEKRTDVSDEALESWLNKLAADAEQTRAELDKEIGFPKRKGWLKDVCARQQLIDELLEGAVITETEAAKTDSGKKE